MSEAKVLVEYGLAVEAETSRGRCLDCPAIFSGRQATRRHAREQHHHVLSGEVLDARPVLSRSILEEAGVEYTEEGGIRLLAGDHG